MTIPSGPVSTPPAPGDGVNALWPFGFSVASAAEVEVIRTAAGGGDTTVDPGLYAVALTSDGASGGAVTYPLGASRVPVGDTITVRLNPNFDQPVDLLNQGDYSPEDVEGALDHQERQILRLRDDQSRMLRGGVGYQINNALGAPINGNALTWRKEADGSYSIVSSAVSNGGDEGDGDGTPTSVRILYASDLLLNGDGTDESDAINAALLALAGQNVSVHLRAPAGYWPISKEILNRSGIQLSFGSVLRAAKAASLSMAGTTARLPAAATLSGPASQGSVVLNAAAVSGALSASFSVGDQIALTGGVNGIYRVTSVNDGGTIEVTPGLRADHAAGIGIRKLVYSYCLAGWNRHDTPTELAVASTTAFAVGDVVWITCDELITNIVTAETFTANSEMAVVTGFGSGTLKFDRPIKHWCSIGNRPRVVKIDPCRNASISGASIEFTEAPDSTRVDVFTATFAYQCMYTDCKVPNTDNYGTRGQSFRFTRCLESVILDGYAGPAKYYGSGESYAASLVHCTACLVQNLTGVGARHVLSWSGSTDCVGVNIAGRGWRVNMVDYHGLRSIGCKVYVVDGQGNSDYSGASGICIGNPSWGGGDYDFGVIGGEITDLEGIEGAGIRINSPVDAGNIQAITFRRLTEGIRTQNFQGDSALESGRVEIACDFHRCAAAGIIDMNRFGGTAKPFNRIDLDGSRWFEFQVGLYIDNVDDIVAAKIVMQTTRATSGEWAVHVDNCGAARIGGMFDGCDKHFYFKDTPFDLANYQIRNPVTTTLLLEASTSPVSGCRDAYGLYPPSWSPGRTSASTTVTVLSLPGMT